MATRPIDARYFAEKLAEADRTFDSTTHGTTPYTAEDLLHAIQVEYIRSHESRIVWENLGTPDGGTTNYWRIGHRTIVYGTVAFIGTVQGFIESLLDAGSVTKIHDLPAHGMALSVNPSLMYS